MTKVTHRKKPVFTSLFGPKSITKESGIFIGTTHGYLEREKEEQKTTLGPRLQRRPGFCAGPGHSSIMTVVSFVFALLITKHS